MNEMNMWCFKQMFQNSPESGEKCGLARASHKLCWKIEQDVFRDFNEVLQGMVATIFNRAPWNTWKKDVPKFPRAL